MAQNIQYSPLNQREMLLAKQLPHAYLDQDGLYIFNGTNASRLNYNPVVKSLPPVANRTRRQLRIRVVLIVFLAIVIAFAAVVGVPLIVAYLKKRSDLSRNSGSPDSHGPTMGKTGSRIITEDGRAFVYTNPFGGDWAADPREPFGVGGKAQEWSKRIGSEEWIWGSDIARGVNLGGWLVTEPFIVPALYEKYLNANSSIKVVDEWTLSLAMGQNLAEEMEQHYKTFITEEDFSEIAGAGLNWVRIPIGFWAIETLNDEPFLQGVSWKYFLKAIQWARKYGIRIYLDLHALPGSQNGWNHSGKAGSVNFMNGIMGISNAQRTLTILRTITQFISQEAYRDIVGIVGMVNEILWDTIGETAVQSFYLAAYEAMRRASGTGSGNGPYIAIHDGFQGPDVWNGFLPGADRLVLDQHPYLAFDRDHSSSLIATSKKPCSWAFATNRSSKAFGVTIGGEWSSAITDCGLWLSGIGSSPRHPECAFWDDWNSYSPETIKALKAVTLANMDALQNFFFWTWKIGASSTLNTTSSPLWNYKLGLERGWVPKDPRESVGYCSKILNSSLPFDGRYPSFATGGAGAGTIGANQLSRHSFPPKTLAPSFTGSQVRLLPTYTPTGAIQTLSALSFTAAPSASTGNGWANPADTEGAYVPISGCSYPSAWDAVDAPLPKSQCTV